MIFASFFIWHYTLGLTYAYDGSVEFVKSVFRYFSVSYLLLSLFSPWHNITVDYGRGFALGEFLFNLAGNAVSRVLGAIVRTFVIIFGLIATAASFVFATLFMVFWLAMPVIIGAFFVVGFALLIP